MTDNLLKTALREAASREFAGMPQSDGDITYTFSPRFTRRMNRLAKAEKSWLWRMTSTASKRAAAAGIAMILIALTACSIPAIREPVAAFFKGTYENCVRFFTGNAGADRIAERYTLTELPDGFEAVYTVDNDASFTVVYRNEDGEEIILSQSVGADYWIDIDTQHGTLTEIDLSGVTVTLYEADGCIRSHHIRRLGSGASAPPGELRSTSITSQTIRGRCRFVCSGPVIFFTKGCNLFPQPRRCIV